MSIIHDLGESNKNFNTILWKYEEDLCDIEQDLAIKGKRLEEACLEQASLQVFYDQKRIELHTLVKYFESEVDRVRGKLWVRFTESHSRDLGPKDKDQYINNEQAYINMNLLYLEANELYKKYEAVVDAFKSRGYSLNNITKIRVAEMSEMVL